MRILLHHLFAGGLPILVVIISVQILGSFSSLAEFFLVLVGSYILGIVFLKFVPIKCPNPNCGKFSLCCSELFPRWAPQNYKCKNCRKAYYQIKGNIHETNCT